MSCDRIKVLVLFFFKDVITFQHTPLYLACKNGNTECVRVLLENGAKLTYGAGNGTGTKFNCLNAAIDESRRYITMIM